MELTICCGQWGRKRYRKFLSMTLTAISAPSTMQLPHYLQTCLASAYLPRNPEPHHGCPSGSPLCSPAQSCSAGDASLHVWEFRCTPSLEASTGEPGRASTLSSPCSSLLVLRAWPELSAPDATSTSPSHPWNTVSFSILYNLSSLNHSFY